MIGFVITTVDSVGDITASAEAGRVQNDGLHSRMQGGILTDGITWHLSAPMRGRLYIRAAKHNFLIGRASQKSAPQYDIGINI